MTFNHRVNWLCRFALRRLCHGHRRVFASIFHQEPLNVSREVNSFIWYCVYRSTTANSPYIPYFTAAWFQGGWPGGEERRSGAASGCGGKMHGARRNDSVESENVLGYLRCGSPTAPPTKWHHRTHWAVFKRTKLTNPKMQVIRSSLCVLPYYSIYILYTLTILLYNCPCESITWHYWSLKLNKYSRFNLLITK